MDGEAPSEQPTCSRLLDPPIYSENRNKTSVESKAYSNTLTTLQTWIKLQRCPRTIPWATAICIFEVLVYTIELFCLLQLFLSKESVGKVNNYDLAATIVIYAATFVLNLLLKYHSTVCFHKGVTSGENDKIKLLFKSILYISRPLRSYRTLQNFKKKWKILGSELKTQFKKNEFKQVAIFNQRDLINARDDLFGNFIQLLPMVIMQGTFVRNDNSPVKIYRILLIALYTFSIIKSSLIYDWRKRSYMNSLHVFGSLRSAGRFPVPEYLSDSVSLMLEFFWRAIAMGSRVYLISYHGLTNWGYLIATTIILVTFSRRSNSTVMCSLKENLPEGSVYSPHFIAELWVNTFVPHEDSLQDIFEGIYKSNDGYKTRIYLPFVHYSLDLLNYCLIYFFSLSVGLSLSTTSMGDIYHLVKIHLSNLIFLGLKGYYKNRRFKSDKTLYPPVVAVMYIRKMFSRILDSYHDQCCKIMKLKTLSYLLCIDMSDFNIEHSKFEEKILCWNVSINDFIKENNPQQMSPYLLEEIKSELKLDGLKFTSEVDHVDWFFRAKEQEEGLRLFLYFCRNRYKLLLSEMSLLRLYRTADMLSLPKAEISAEVMQEVFL